MAVQSPSFSKADLEAAIQRCAQEPIHHVGRIQSCGALLALDPRTFRVTHASANTDAWLGAAAEELIGQPWDRCVELVGGGDLAAALGGVSPGESRMFLARRAGHPGSEPGDGAGAPLLLTASHGDAVLLELTASDTDASPFGIGGYPFDDRVCAIFDAQTLEEQHQTLAGFVRELFGYDRVMVYRFDEQWDGEVIAEAKDEGVESFLGMHFPASDIPEQARRLYARSAVRAIMDVDGESVPILPVCDEGAGAPLDLSGCGIRFISPVHLQSLRNIGVGASLSISLMQGDRLWGLVVCHHLTPRLVSAGYMQLARVISSLVSSQLMLRRETEHLRRATQLAEAIGGVRSAPVSSGGLEGRVWDAIRRFADSIDAPEVFAVLRGQMLCTDAQALPEIGPKVLEYLQTNCDSQSVYCTRRLPVVLPEAVGARGLACGVLAVRVGLGWHNAVLFLRPEQVEEVTWAGRVGDTGGKQIDEHGRLCPRASFEAWTSRVELTSRAFLPADIEAAHSLREVLGDILVHRGERELRQTIAELQARNEEMEAIVYTVSHELRSPLVTIDGFLNKALDELGRGNKAVGIEHLGWVQKAAGQIRLVTQDMLEVSRAGRSGGAPELVSIQGSVERAATRVWERYHSEAAFEIRVSGALGAVMANTAQVDRVFENLMGNAVKYGLTDTSRVIEVVGEVGEGETVVRVRDHGRGIPAQFGDRVFQLFSRVDTTGQEGTGAGLAIVRRIMHAIGGGIELNPDVEDGAEFVLRFPLAPEGEPARIE